jgi:hypothetical protein
MPLERQAPMTNKLIESAKASRAHERRKYKDNEIELALAWLNGDVTYQGISDVTNKTGSTVYGFLALCLFEARRRGPIKIQFPPMKPNQQQRIRKWLGTRTLLSRTSSGNVRSRARPGSLLFRGQTV